MNVLTSLFGDGLQDALIGIITHVTADMLQPILRKFLHRSLSDAGRQRLSTHATAFAAALDAKKDDEAATELADIIGEIKLK